jgi:CheY-like chemotaxis protein
MPDDAMSVRERRLDIRVMLTDVSMPGSMDGLTLAQTVRNRWPAIDIIVTLGLTLANDHPLPDRVIFFSKPYTSAQISSALNTFVSH